jgi:hypothetical protein
MKRRTSRRREVSENARQTKAASIDDLDAGKRLCWQNQPPNPNAWRLYGKPTRKTQKKNIGMNGKRVGLYLRVSTDDQTVENQREALTAACEARGWRIVETFEDPGISGAKGREKRPGFDRLHKAVTRRSIDVVAAWSVDRLGRSLQDLVGFLAELNASGCDLYLDRPLELGEDAEHLEHRPASRRRRIDGLALGRPMGLPLFVPRLRARAMPALTRSWRDAAAQNRGDQGRIGQRDGCSEDGAAVRLRRFGRAEGQSRNDRVSAMSAETRRARDPACASPDRHSDRES